MFKFDTQKPLEKLVLARASLKEFLPLIYPVAMRFDWKEEPSIPTCAVDKEGNFYYNKDFISSLRDLNEAINVVAHEAMHIVQKHHYRTPILPGIEQQAVNLIFNLASDRVLTALLWNDNEIFKNNRIITEVLNIDQKVVDEVTNNYKYTEALFQDMLKAYQKSKAEGSGSKGKGTGQSKSDKNNSDKEGQSGQGQGQGNQESSHDVINHVRNGLSNGPIKDSLRGGEGPCQAHKYHGKGENEETSADSDDGYDPWRMSVQMGKDLQKQRGDQNSMGMKEFLTKLFAPKISWKSVLMQYLDKVFGFHEYNYYRRARRSITEDIIFPGNDPPYGRVAVAIDMSGSMSMEERIAALSETYAICNSYVSGVLCIMHTTDVYFAGTIKEPEDVKKIPWSTGGTSHLEVFDVVNGVHKKWTPDDDENPIQLLVCFTDMETCFPKTAPKIPVIWVDTTSRAHAAPFGEVIHYKM
jgi:predicted metal-dependent peptidase